MSKSLLEELPKIVSEGKKTAERILEQLEGRHRVSLQTRELVIPSKDTRQSDLFRSAPASNQIKSNQIKSNQIKSNQIKSNQIKSNQIKCCIP